MNFFPLTFSSLKAIIAAFSVAFLVITSSSNSVQAQELSFSDVGNADYDNFGYKVAISGDGMYMAAGADGGVNGGYAKVYAKTGTRWGMIQQINGTLSLSGGQFGWSLDLSHNGSMLAISTYNHAVYMYEFSRSSFLYELIYTTDDIGAWEVAVSGDGMVVGVTSGAISIGATIFERVGNGFQKRGRDFLEYGLEGGIGLNDNGTIAIIGDPYWSSANDTSIGRAAVFQWEKDNVDGSMQWMQMGYDIIGDAPGNYLGWWGGVSITYEGLTVAVGAEGYDRDGLTDRGLVRVYNHDSISATWKQSGIDLLGDISYDFFSMIAFSSDGLYISIGAYASNYVKVFKKNGNNYEIVGDTIVGEEGSAFGFSVDMSADGSALAIGGAGFDISKGRLYLYDTDLTSPPSSSTIAPTASSTPPPSLHKSSFPTAFPTVSPSFATLRPSKIPSSSPSKVTSVNPTRDTTNSPSKNASDHPTLNLSTHPSIFPSEAPSGAPITSKPTSSLTMFPTTAAPTNTPSFATFRPSKIPSSSPSKVTSVNPTRDTTNSPSKNASDRPTLNLSTHPSRFPSKAPSGAPITPKPTSSLTIFPTTAAPTNTPSFATFRPSKIPSSSPSKVSSANPSAFPSNSPSDTSVTPSRYPSSTPNAAPSMKPTLFATRDPSMIPSINPSVSISFTPSTHPSNVSSTLPSLVPSTSPNVTPSVKPSQVPIAITSDTPSKDPSIDLSSLPSVPLSNTPSLSPSVTPSSTPSMKPTRSFTITPSISPSATPSSTPSITPVDILSKTPSSTPSSVPSEITTTPSMKPTGAFGITPSISPSATPSSTPSNAPLKTNSFTPSDIPSLVPSTSPIKETPAPSFLTQVESSTNIFMSTTGVSTTDVTLDSLTALGTVTMNFFSNLTGLTVTEVNITVAMLDENVIDNGERFLQDDDSATLLFDIETLSSATTPVQAILMDYLMTNMMDFTIMMRDSDPAFSGLIDLQVNSVPSLYPSLAPSFIPSPKPIRVTEIDVTFEPTKTPTASPTISYVPTISFIPTFDPTSSPTSAPTNDPSKVRSEVPSQTPSLTPPVTSNFMVPYERITNSTTHNLTAVEAVLKEDDLSLLNYLAADEALSDEPFEVENVISQVIDADDADVCFDSSYLCYTINTNVTVTRYPVTYSTNRSELIVLSSVLDFMEERDIAIVPLVSVPDNIESILSIVFGGVPANEMNEVEVEAFVATTYDFLFENLGQALPPVLVEEVTFLSQSLSQPSTNDESSSEDDGDEPAGAELTVNLGVSGEYLPPPEIIFDEVIVEVFDEEGQEDYLEVLLTSDNKYFEVAHSLDILDVQVLDSVAEDRSSGSVFGLLGDEGGYSIIFIGCAIVLLIVGVLIREKHLRYARTKKRNEDLKAQHLEVLRIQSERSGEQDQDRSYVGMEEEIMGSNRNSSNENFMVGHSY